MRAEPSFAPQVQQKSPPTKQSTKSTAKPTARLKSAKKKQADSKGTKQQICTKVTQEDEFADLSLQKSRLNEVQTKLFFAKTKARKRRAYEQHPERVERRKTQKAKPH